MRVSELEEKRAEGKDQRMKGKIMAAGWPRGGGGGGGGRRLVTAPEVISSVCGDSLKV